MDHTGAREGRPSRLPVADSALHRSGSGIHVPSARYDWNQITEGSVYDVPNCELGHHGEEVSFDAILKKYVLTDPALLLLADIVRAADSHPSNAHPAGEGLRWVAHGFSALGLSDREILAREFIVYDALYKECQRRVAGDQEQHVTR